MEPHKILAIWNGHSCPLDEVSISPLDRGYVFGDGVYEVVRIYQGRPFLFDEHLERLRSSLLKISIANVSGIADDILRNIDQNAIIEGMIYLQITRGTAPRMHSYSDLNLKPNVLIYGKHFAKHPAAEDAARGIKAITLPDQRWGRCDIKSLNLLANCMAQSDANTKGCIEALLFRNNAMLSEGSSSNVFIVKDGAYHTPPLSNEILPGTRRNFLIKELKKANLTVYERPIAKSEVLQADEIFITSSIREATPVVTIDDRPVGTGSVGALAKLARKVILQGVKEQCG